MKSIMIFAAVITASITPVMALDIDYNNTEGKMRQMEREMFYQQQEMRERMHQQGQQLRNLQLQQMQERWR